MEDESWQIWVLRKQIRRGYKRGYAWIGELGKQPRFGVDLCTEQANGKQADCFSQPGTDVDPPETPEVFISSYGLDPPPGYATLGDAILALAHSNNKISIPCSVMLSGKVQNYCNCGVSHPACET
jgi:hypothetical protein